MSAWRFSQMQKICKSLDEIDGRNVLCGGLNRDVVTCRPVIFGFKGTRLGRLDDMSVGRYFVTCWCRIHALRWRVEMPAWTIGTIANLGVIDFVEWARR